MGLQGFEVAQESEWSFRRAVWIELFAKGHRFVSLENLLRASLQKSRCNDLLTFSLGGVGMC